MADTPFLFPERDAGRPPPVSLGDVVALLWRNAFLIGASTLLVTALAIGLYYLQVPTYVSTARVLVQTDQIGTPSFLSGIAAYRESQIAEPVSRKIETEMALILNRANAAEVVEALNVQPAQLPSSPLARAREKVGGVLRQWTGKSRAEAPGNRSRVVDDFIANIGVEPVRSKTAETTSNVLEVTLETADPALAPRALADLLGAYLRVSSEQNRRLGDATTLLLKSQIAQAKGELDRSENDIVALAVRESEQAALAAAASTASAGARRESRTSYDTASAQMVMQLLDLQGQLDELRQTYTDETESVRKLKQRVADMRNRLAGQVRASARNTAAFDRLERQRALALDHYVELRRKLNQIDLYMQLTPAALDGRLMVDAPSTPDAGQARKKKIIALAGPMAGLLLGLLLAALREFLRPRMRTQRELERALSMPMLGALPSFRDGQPHGQPESLLLPRIALALRGRLPERETGGHVVLVTSANAREGKSFVAGLLVRELAQAAPAEAALIAGDGATGQPLFAQADRAVPPKQLFQPDEVAHALRGLRQRFKIALIDGPVLSHCGALLQQVDAVLLVVDSRATSPQSIRRAMATASIDAPAIDAAVLNRAPDGVSA
ncbi:MAG: hypothetical protein EOO22_01560 [Comamonadaceae bacterium]|nr:MAG: hypothetical protein EOO22_01560 [Comamonadaceae bacterium]